MSDTTRIPAQFLVERNGKQFVLYAGVLSLAHEQGLKRIRTQLVQIPSDSNGGVAICCAEVETDRGTFTGIGDAAPNNVTTLMQTCTIRMAETRAKARALRDAVNIGVAAIEELGESDAPPFVAPAPTAPARPPTSAIPAVAPADGATGTVTTGTVTTGTVTTKTVATKTAPVVEAAPIRTSDQMTYPQRVAISSLQEDLHWDDPTVESVCRQAGGTRQTMTKRQASFVIDFMKRSIDR